MSGLALLVAASALLPAPAGATTATHHVSHAPRCTAPTHLRFRRALGSTVGTLRWTTRRRRVRVRVFRDGHLVGQTTRHALHVPVKLDRTHRFTVVPLTAGGRQTHCRGTRRMRIVYRRPGAPRDLTVVGGEGGLRLSWRRGRRGDGALNGYRLLRNGATIGQTAKTGWEIAASANRSYRFAVVAVDSRGRASKPSNAVTAVTGHTPPSAPRGVQALPVSESEIGIQWQASSTAAGRVVGYRLLRDGAVVGQTQGTTFVLRNLAPSTDYHLSVVAIDSLGYVSAPSDTVTTRTQDPVPTTGHAQAYLLASTDQSFADFRAHYQQIGVIYPTYFDCTASAALAGADDPLVTRWAQARQVDVLPRINCQRASVLDRILTDPATRASWLDQLTALAADNGYNGVSLDFETGPASDRAALTSFVQELAARLHGAGRLLTIAVSPKTYDSLTHPRSGIFDYPRLSQYADWVFVMTWGLHWAKSEPGAQDSIDWVRQVDDYVATMPLKHRFVYGTNLYGLDWPAGGGAANPATGYEYDDLMGRLPGLGASPVLDTTADAYHATYVDGGVSHEVWFPDAGTTSRRIDLAAARGLGGVGLWRLGREDRRVWDDPRLAPGRAW